MSPSSVNRIKINQGERASQSQPRAPEPSTKTPIHRRRWIGVYILHSLFSAIVPEGTPRDWQVMSPKTMSSFTSYTARHKQTGSSHARWKDKETEAGGRGRACGGRKKKRLSWKSQRNAAETELRCSPGSHPGYQVEVIMLWSANEFIS